MLITDVLVRAQKEIVTGSFGALDKFPVIQFMPTHLRGPRDIVADKAAGNGSRGAVIEQNFHGAGIGIGAFARLWLAK